ncbi:MAG: hypothetical protein EAZ92_13040, partial [Candidatus Kapaibacterium sp.]
IPFDKLRVKTVSDLMLSLSKHPQLYLVTYLSVVLETTKNLESTDENADIGTSLLPKRKSNCKEVSVWHDICVTSN